MHYNNQPFLNQLQMEGLALNNAIQTKKILVAVLVLVSLACAYTTLQGLRLRTAVPEGQQRKE